MSIHHSISRSKPCPRRAPRSPVRVAARLAKGAGRRGMRSDVGQTALIMVIGFVVLMTTIGGVMVTSIVNNDPILTQASIQRYAYRALASGLNAYQSAINADPYLAACNVNTNDNPGEPPLGADATAQCAGISYETWSLVPGTGVGNGIIPEYYKFDNPQQVINATTKGLVDLEVQIVGAAGFGSNLTYYSTVAKFTPANGFLDNVWWTNYESSPNNPPLNVPAQCTYYWATYTLPSQCSAVNFDSQDNIFGPIFSNDSIYVDGSPNFGASYGVTTADPNCQFVDPGVNSGGNNLGAIPNNVGKTNNCAQTANDENVTYNAAQSSFSASNFEKIPTDNSQLGNYAEQGGCYYTGPTTITLLSSGKMTVLSEGTKGYPGVSSFSFGSDTSTCPTNGTTQVALPVNGMLFVDNGDTTTPAATNINPFEGIGQTCGTGFGAEDPCDQTSIGANACNGCYYGQTSTPDSEGDAFVSGALSGHLTIGAKNDVVIQGPLTYADCAGNWAGTANESPCNYRNASTAVNDTLGLIAYKYVEVSRPVDGNGNVLGYCGQTGSLAAPLCNPATSGGGGLVVDASLLGLSQSFIVNNWTQGNNDGQLIVYGSIQQDARGEVAQLGGGGNVQNGFGKTYTWDPRLALYSPPYYLTPGTPSWALESSSESYTGTCPEVPPVQATPTSTQPTWPWNDPPDTPAGTTCVAAP